MNWCLRRELHSHLAGFEADVSAVGLHRLEVVLPVSLALTLTPGLKQRPLLWATGAGGREPREESEESECWWFCSLPSALCSKMVPKAGVAPALDRL